LYGTDPKSRSDDYSRIISPKAVDRFVSLIDQSKVVAGGSADREERYLDPTILYPVTWDDRSWRTKSSGRFSQSYV